MYAYFVLVLVPVYASGIFFYLLNRFCIQYEYDFFSLPYCCCVYRIFLRNIEVARLLFVLNALSFIRMFFFLFCVCVCMGVSLSVRIYFIHILLNMLI